MQQRTTTSWTEPRVEGSPRLRVLIESDDPALAISDFRRFSDQGLDVALCSGPEHGPGECPLVAGEGCPVIDSADVVLFNLGRRNAAILEAELREHADTPVVVQVPAGASGDLPAGCEVLPAFSSVDGQIGALRRAALAGRRR